MNRNLGLMAGLLVAMPLAIEIPAVRDSGSTTGAETRLRVAGGYGYYAFIARDCEGRTVDRVPVHARNGAIALDHRFARVPLRVGVRAGSTRDAIGTPNDSTLFIGVPTDRTLTNRYVNPFVEFDTPGGDMSFGYVFRRHEFLTADEDARTRSQHPLNNYSLHMRVGRLEHRYFQVSWMEGMPLYSDGGYLTLGIGGPPVRRMEGFVGVGAGGPMEGAGPLLRASYALRPDLRVQVALHGNEHGAGTVGLAVEYRHRSQGGP